MRNKSIRNTAPIARGAAGLPARRSSRWWLRGFAAALGAVAFSAGAQGSPRGGGAGDEGSALRANVLAEPQLTISLVPVSTGPDVQLEPDTTINGNEITLAGSGGMVFLEVRVSDWDLGDKGIKLKAFQSALDSSGYTAGVQGMLAPNMVSCDAGLGDVDANADGIKDKDEPCIEAYGGVCTISGGPCRRKADCPGGTGDRCQGSTCAFPAPAPVYCEPVWLFTGRPEYVFVGTDHFGAVNFETLDYRFGAAHQEDGVPSPDPFPAGGAYAGTLVLHVSDDAVGTFPVGWEQIASHVVNQNNAFIPIFGFVPARITIETGRCCFALISPQPDCIDSVYLRECKGQPGLVIFAPSEQCPGEVTVQACGCFPADPPEPELIRAQAEGDLLAVSTKNRYVSFKTGGLNVGRQQAVRVTLVDVPASVIIQNPAHPQAGEFLAPEFLNLVGTSLWVGEPQPLCTALGGAGFGDACGGTGETIRVAPLVCEQDKVVMDWSTLKSCRYRACTGGTNDGNACTEDADCPGGNCVTAAEPGSSGPESNRNGISCTGPADCPGGACEQDVIHVYHEIIFPGGQYGVQVLDVSCNPANEADFTDPLVLESQAWGDIVGGRIPPAGGWTPPNHDTELFDMLAILDAAMSKLSTPIRSRTDLEGIGTAIVDGRINIGDLLRVIDAARRLPYPFAAPLPPCVP